MAANLNNSICFFHNSAVAGNAEYTMIRTGVVYDAFAVANGAAAGTCTVSKAGAAITDAIDVNNADTTLTRAATIDDANSTFAIGDVLRVAKSAAVSTWTIGYLASTGYVA